MDLMDFQAMQAGFPRVFPTDSKELSSTQKLDSVIWSSPVPCPFQAQELSYLFDFIDIDESGQVNKEDIFWIGLTWFNLW